MNSDTIIQLTEDVYAVKVHDDGYSFLVTPLQLFYQRPDNFLKNSTGLFEVIDIGFGIWHIIGKGWKEIDEETAVNIVEVDYFDGIGLQFANYSIERKWTFGKRFNTAIESLRSLLISKGLNPDDNYIFIQKK